MSDLINRQDAIDALKVCITIGRGNGKSVALKIANDYADIVKKRIEELPSAEPEIVRCCKCGYWDRDSLRHQFNDFRDWNEAECEILADRDPYHEINRYTEADDFCSYAERRTDE